jgi:hypothetical protein
MNTLDEHELRALLQCYEVDGPDPALVADVTHRMHQEILPVAREPLKQERGAFVLVGLAVAMSLCFFYMLTVGTILRFLVPTSLLDIVRHSLHAFTVAGGCLLVGGIMVFYIKQLYAQRVARMAGGAPV